MPISIRQYARLVEAMRRTQKEYSDIRARRPDTLARSEKLEEALDKVTAEILNGPRPFAEQES